MQQQGYEKWQIASALDVHIKTVDCKLRDLKKGMAKNAYIMPTELQSPQQDLISLCCSEN